MGQLDSSMMRPAVSVGLCVALLAGVGGCTVGSGTGTANGPLWIVGCKNGQDFFTNDYHLDPTFFAGDPIEDISQGAHTNRLRVRMQRYGVGQEDDDTLKFDFENSVEVARCIRGYVFPDGTPDWDPRFINVMNGRLEDTPGDNVPWCDWSAATTDPDAGMSVDAGVSVMGARPRIHFSSEGYTKAWLNPAATCPLARLIGIGRYGWIEPLEFGSAADQADLPPNERTQIKADSDFKVEFGERLHALFHIELQDDKVRVAQERGDLVPPARLGGTLEGYFDFTLQRGRALQQFP